MKTKTRSVQQIIEEQMQRWQLMKTKKVKEKQGVFTITISREPGSGGRVVAKKLAAKTRFRGFSSGSAARNSQKS